MALDVPGCGAKRGRDTSGVEFDDIARELTADGGAVGRAEQLATFAADSEPVE